MGWMGRAQASGDVAASVDEAMASFRRAAAANGLTLDEAASSATSLTFKKSIKLFSWGSTVVADFEPVDEQQTRISIATRETYAISDWGRGRRLANTLLADVSASS